MGGRGYHNDLVGYINSSGRTSEYGELVQYSKGNIKYLFDKISPRAPLIPEFSNTPNRVYVLLDKTQSKIKSITVYDENHEQKYSIHLDHPHKGKRGPHVHSGFKDGRKDIPLTKEHNKIIKEVTSAFYSKKGR